MSEPSEANLIEYLDEVDETMDQTGHGPCGCEAVVRKRVVGYPLLERQLAELGRTVAWQAEQLAALSALAASANSPGNGLPCPVVEKEAAGLTDSSKAVDSVDSELSANTAKEDHG